MVRNLYLGIIVLLLHGCFNKNTDPSKNAQNKFIIVTGTKGMNNGSALTIDVVQVYEEYIWNELSDMKAEDYFKKRDSVLKKNANIWTINVVEDFWARPFLLKGYQDRCIGTILFTTYPNAINKVKLKDKFDCTSLRLGPAGILKAESATFVVTDYTVVDPR
jgi:hypothetical protein